MTKPLAHEIWEVIEDPNYNKNDYFHLPHRKKMQNIQESQIIQYVTTITKYISIHNGILVEEKKEKKKYLK